MLGRSLRSRGDRHRYAPKEVHAEPDGPAEPCRPVSVQHLRSVVRGRLWSFADFDLGTAIGSGTLSRIRIARANVGKDQQTPFVLKIMRKLDVIQKKQVQHVLNERLILNVVEHPFVVNMFTTFQDTKCIFMLMEYVNGGDLFSYLRREGYLSNDHARFYAGELILAIAYLHVLNIAYRDLKPENVLLDCEGHVKLTDFGFAKVVKDTTGTLCGTPQYLAPEIIQGGRHSKAVDWWAMGILIFEMLAGETPFNDDSPFGIYKKVLNAPLKFPRHFDMKVQDLASRLLERDPTFRLGCFGRGSEDIKRHKWYRGLDWDRLLNRTMPPPFVPPVESTDDTSMFDPCPDSGGPVRGIPVKFQHLFDDFSPSIT